MTQVSDALSEGTAFALDETTYGQVPSVPAAGDAFRFRNFNSIPADQLIQTEEAGQGRSPVPGIVGPTTVNVSLEVLMRPAASAGAANELDKLLVNLIGGKSVTQGGVEYALANKQTKSLALFQATEAVQEATKGVAFTNGTFTISGRGLTTLALTGVGTDRSLLTPFTAAAEIMEYRDYLDVGNIISNDGGAAAVVTSVNGRTVAPAIADSDVITSGLPAGTYPATLPNFGTAGRFSLDGGTVYVEILGATIGFGNGVIPRDGIVGTTGPSAVESPARRNIQFTVNMIAETNAIRRIAAIKRNTFYDAVLDMGDVNGRYQQWDMSQIQFSQPGIQRNLDATSTITLNGSATAKAGERNMEFFYRLF